MPVSEKLLSTCLNTAEHDVCTEQMVLSFGDCPFITAHVSLLKIMIQICCVVVLTFYSHMSVLIT